MKRKVLIALIILTFCYLFLRLYKIEQHVNFSDEQGKFLLTSYNIWKNKILTLLGPPTSFNYEGRYFFQGPIFYYLLIPPLLLGDWNPIFGSYFIIFLNLFAVYLIYFSVRKIAGGTAAFISALFFSVLPDTVYYTQFVWNPNFLPVISSIIMALLVDVISIKKPLKMFFLGFFLGLALQFHYQIILLGLLILGYLFFKEKIGFKYLMILLIGFVVGYLPIVLFEFRNNFYNTKTIIFLLRHGAFFNRGPAPSYYLLSFYPFLLAFIGILLNILIKRRSILGFTVLTIFVLMCIIFNYLQFKNLRGMPKGWKFLYAKEAARIIEEQKPSEFNIVNLLPGDTRAYQIRYLVTVAGLIPNGVEDYPNSNKLFVVSSDPENVVVANPVWEISSFRPFKVVNEWSIGDNFKLYQFNKTR